MTSSSNLSEDKIKTFIELEFGQRVCNKYARNGKSKSDDCQCGRTIKWHRTKKIDIILNTDHTTWKTETHTKKIKCNSFGEINFKSFDQHSQISPYVRLDSKTDPKLVWELLTNYWHIPIPKLLISVTGGAKYFDMRSEVKSILKQALCHAATSTGAWIITGGTGTGIMKMIGEAVHEYIMPSSKQNETVVTLGITTWGIVSNRSALESKGEKELSPATYDVKAVKKDAKGAPLDHNHSHFILVDDGTENIYGGEIEFRTALESYISKKLEKHVPIVTLVVEGGVNTMKTVCESVKHNTPVVVIEGSGKAADLISHAYKLVKPEKNNPGKVQFPPDVEDTMKDKVRRTFVLDEDKEENIKVCLDNLKKTLECRNLVTIFDLKTADARKDNNTINQAILTALIKANKISASQRLDLAVKWNCCDIARNEILNKTNKQNPEKINYEAAMMKALKKDKADFVNLFIDSGVSLKKFLTIKSLHSLYLKLYKNNKDTQALFIQSLIRNLRLSSKHDEKYLLNNISELTVFLLKQYPLDFYSDKKYTVEPEEKQSQDGCSSSQETKTNVKETFDFTNPEKDLFLWAVLFNRREMAALFWQLGKDQLGAGLIASALLKSLSEQAEIKEELELSRNLASHAELFERHSTELLSECYSRDKEMSHELLVRELPSWGNLTLFSIADTYSMMDFMEHSSCQTKINSIWKGQMVPYTPELKILLCIFFPIFLPLIKFTSNDNPITITKRWICSNKVDVENTSAASGSPETKNKEYEVNLFNNDKNINIVYAGIYFCFAPVTKFFFNVLSYVVLLAVFSYFVLVDLRPVAEPQSPSKWEIIAWIWIATMIIEEIRQVFIRSETSIKYRIQNWFSNMWNKFDLLMYSMLILCIILRFCLITSNFSWAHRMYSLTLITFYFRSTQFLLAAKNIGPKVIMIYRMLNDLMYFFYILLVFVVSFGIAYHINMYPNSPQSWTILKNVLLMPYLQMYRELFQERVEGEETPGCTRNQSIWQENPDLRCPEADGLSTLLLSVYLLLTNILLVNLVIAMFSHTFQSVQSKSRKIWRFHRLSLITEYQDCPTLAPPLIIFNHLSRIIIWKLCKNNEKSQDPKKDECLNKFEKVATNHYLSHTNLLEGQEFNISVSRIAERSVSDETVDDLSEPSNDISQIKNMLQMYINERQQTQIWHKKDNDP